MHPQTLWVAGKLKNRDVTILIDGGSTHNCIDQAIATKLGLPVTRDKQFQVMVANREKIECVGFCQAITINVQGQSITADYYVLPVAACQLVLGIQWLATLGPIEMDYARLSMSYREGENIRSFQGLQRPGMANLIEKEFFNLQGTLFFLQIRSVGSSNQPKKQPPDLAQLLTSFSHIIETPKTLPPSRFDDYCFPLQPNADPISVRPYRYPYY